MQRNLNSSGKLTPSQIKEIREIARSCLPKVKRLCKQTFGDGEYLGGMCARASALLFKRLIQHKYKPRIVFGEGHVYLEIGDRILDITANQFDTALPPVLFMTRKNFLTCYTHLPTLWAWERRCVVDSVEQAMAHQEANDWSEEQLICPDDWKEDQNEFRTNGQYFE